jgi:ribosomal protein RSM22 (predicted rRNA methylase)
MMGSDWCHFAERIERSSLHRRLKQGALGYEDEKFSYLIVAKEPHSLPNARIVRHPQHHSGHTGLTLCTSKGSLEAMTVSRRTPELYKRVRKAEWGDSW